MSGHVGPINPVGQERLYSRVDWLFLMFLVLEFITFALLPGLPLLVAAASMQTQVRSSKWRTVVLWTIAGVLTLIVIAPFVIGLFDLTIVEVDEGPLIPAG